MRSLRTSLLVIATLCVCTAGQAAAFYLDALACERLGKRTAEIPSCCRPNAHAQVSAEGSGCCTYLELDEAPPQEHPGIGLRVAKAAPAVPTTPPWTRSGYVARGEIHAPSAYSRPPPVPIPTKDIILLI